jgi:GNAT superfamily N-acetyltransferase
MRAYELAEDISAFSSYIQNKYDLESFFVYEKGDLITLGMLKVADKKQGTGTAVMNELINYADQNNKRIFLTPGLPDDRHGTTSRGRLVKFYKRFGFVENKGRNKDFTLPVGMYREPK